jgi:hypothetical protein
MDFVPNQVVHAVALGKTFHKAFAVLVYALDEVGRYANIKRALVTAGQEVDTGLLFHAKDSGSCDGKGIDEAGVHRPWPWMPALTPGYPARRPSGKCKSAPGGFVPAGMTVIFCADGNKQCSRNDRAPP